MKASQRRKRSNFEAGLLETNARFPPVAQLRIHDENKIWHFETPSPIANQKSFCALGMTTVGDLHPA
jgi:hypothetical protein